MSREKKSARLLAVKSQLGRLSFLDYTQYDLIEAHRQLGAEVSTQVHKILRSRLDRLDEDDFRIKICQARACLATLRERAGNDALSGLLRMALKEYLACLQAWSHGAELELFTGSQEASCQVDGRAVSAMELAMLLQHDNSGCQTGMYRQMDGSVTLWHSEEDNSPPGERFDQLRLATFAVQGEGRPVRLNAFIYPDLLPGSAFAWRSDGYVQAVDTILIKSSPNLGSGTLANVASWVALRLGAEVDSRQVLEALQPYWDGYALNVVHSQEGQVSASKHEFAADRVLSCCLDQKPGSFLFQANVFSQREDVALLAMENLPLDESRFYEERMARTQRALQRTTPQELSKDHELDFFLSLLASRAGGDGAYANADVKAYFVNWISSGEMEIWLGPGPALLDEQPIVLESPT